jgi:hypothetical protein
MPLYNHSFKDEIDEILQQVEKQGLSLRYKRGMLSLESLTQTSCLGLHVQLSSLQQDGVNNLILEENFGGLARKVSEIMIIQRLKASILKSGGSQLRFVVATGLNSSIAGQVF